MDSREFRGQRYSIYKYIYIYYIFAVVSPIFANQKRYLVISLFGYYEELSVIHLTP